MLSLAALAAVLAIVLGGSSIQVRGLVGMVAAYSTFVIGAGAIGYVAAKSWTDQPSPRWRHDHIPARVLGAALLWWRVYRFYILLVGGAIVAGAAVLRSLRQDAVADMVTE
jgi:hypothetical protein